MTLEEEITKLEGDIKYYEKMNYPGIAISEGKQMLEWLKELKRYRESDEVTK